MGSKRQLPPWMLRAAATEQVSNSVSEAKHRGNGLEEVPTEAYHPDSSVEVQQHVAEVTKTDLCLVKKCKTTRSRRKPVKRAEDDVSNMHEGDVEKENYALPRRKRKAKVLKETKSNAVEESTLSEDELSVDDLISIAKEYINAEKGKEGQRSSFAECESESLPRSISSRDKTTHKDNTSSCDSISNVNTLECQPSERGVISSSKTGELTQDLLELFLGPFVRRLGEVKPNPEPVTNSAKLDCPPSNQTLDGL